MKKFAGDTIILCMCIKNHNHIMYSSWELEILPFYICMCTINEDRMIYGSRNIRCDRYKFLSFWANFCPFSPLAMWKINILKLKKNPGDIIILHICTINYNHMMYFYWDIEHDRENFLSFWTVFCPFTPLWTQKVKILKKWNKCLEISFTYVYHKWLI